MKFCPVANFNSKGLINEKESLIVSRQVSPNKALMAHNKNPKKSFNNAKGSYSHTSNHTNNNGHASHEHHQTSKRKKVYDPCKHCGENNHPKKNCFKAKHLMAKANKKNSNESQVALCAFVVLSSNYSSNVEWIIDYGASKHMTGNVSLFTSYDTNKHSSQKVSIGDGKQLSIIGSSNINVSNDQLEDVFMFKTCPSTYFLFIVHVIKVLNLKLGLINMFVKISIETT